MLSVIKPQNAPSSFVTLGKTLHLLGVLCHLQMGGDRIFLPHRIAGTIMEDSVWEEAHSWYYSR